MKSLARKTGGYIINAESFEYDEFSESFRKLWVGVEDDADSGGDDEARAAVKRGYNATFEVRTSRELKVAGLIGNAESLQRQGANVSESETGLGTKSPCL